jgi:hypothetical protein
MDTFVEFVFLVALVAVIAFNVYVGLEILTNFRLPELIRFWGSGPSVSNVDNRKDERKPECKEYEGSFDDMIVMKSDDKRSGGLIYGTLKKKWDANLNPGRIVIMCDGDSRFAEGQIEGLFRLWEALMESEEDGEIFLLNTPVEAMKDIDKWTKKTVISCETKNWVKSIKLAKLPDGLEWKR